MLQKGYKMTVSYICQHQLCFTKLIALPHLIRDYLGSERVTNLI